ncbi:putative methionine sulfoxide reductase [Dissophora ornata]|nr:putative methionine sulfoxide reductase [Dissophora ornata]
MSRLVLRAASFSSSHSTASTASYSLSRLSCSRRPLAATASSLPRAQPSTRSYSFFSSKKSAIDTKSLQQTKSATTGNTTSATAAATPAFDNANMTQPKSEEEWRAVLNPEQFRILRQKGTEMAYTGEYTKNKDQGVYRCAGCQTPLYTSSTKFDACGWCSFYDAVPGAVGRHPDPDGRRVEIVCNACGGHLGHVFKGEGYGNPTDERHCVNSISLKFQPGDV